MSVAKASNAMVNECVVWGLGGDPVSGQLPTTRQFPIAEFQPLSKSSQLGAPFNLCVCLHVAHEGRAHRFTQSDMEAFQNQAVLGAALFQIPLNQDQAKFVYIPLAEFRTRFLPLMEAANRIFCFDGARMYALLRAAPCNENRWTDLDPSDIQKRFFKETKGDILNPNASPHTVHIRLTDIEGRTRAETPSFTATTTEDKRTEAEWSRLMLEAGTATEQKQKAKSDEKDEQKEEEKQEEKAEEKDEESRLQKRLDSLKTANANTNAESYNKNDTAEAIAKYKSSPRILSSVPEEDGHGCLVKRTRDGYFHEQELIYCRFKTNSILDDFKALPTTNLQAWVWMNETKLNKPLSRATKAREHWTRVCSNHETKTSSFPVLSRVHKITDGYNGANKDETLRELFWDVAVTTDICTLVYSLQQPMTHQKTRFDKKSSRSVLETVETTVTFSRPNLLSISSKLEVPRRR